MSHHKHDHKSESQPGGREALELSAYRLWDRAGRPEGQADRFWSEAREQILQSHEPEAAHHGRG